MRFKLFGTEIYVSFLFAAAMAFILATDRTGLALPVFVAAAFHEAGHLFAMWTLECAPKRIKLIPASVQITLSFSGRFRNDIIITLCGPLMNLILFLTLYINFIMFGSNVSLQYGLVNLLIGLFNLLPLKGLDGGALLYALVARRGNINKAELTLRIITLISGVALIFLGVWMAFRIKVNPSLFIMGIYLLITSVMKM